MRRFIIGFLASLGAIGLLLAIGTAQSPSGSCCRLAPEVPQRAVLTVDLREALDEAAHTTRSLSSAWRSGWRSANCC